MLWKKESNQPTALYVDLFAKTPVSMIDRALQAFSQYSNPAKSNQTALQKRMQGNALFDKRKWAEAMEKYNESLCFAIVGSKHISLAYANRASCFLKLKLYNECLIDIELAKKSGYPRELMSKLNKRESDCLKCLAGCLTFRDANPELPAFNQKLSFDADENVPCMANVLSVNRNEMGKLSTIAQQDIDVGQTIVMGKAFLVYLYSRFGWKCNSCLKDNTNLMPCSKCTVAMFCSDECQNNVLHKDECGLKFHTDKQQNGLLLNEIRLLLIAMNIFDTVDELMNFVEDAVKCDNIPISLVDDRSKYRMFLKMPISIKFAQKPDFLFIVYSIYKACLNVKKISKQFDTVHRRRFLMHLISQHTQITNFNSNHVSSRPKDEVDFYQQIGLTLNFFNHSCAPNVSMNERNGNSVYVTIRPIKKGDELFISYFKFLLQPKHVRQQCLWNEKHIKCNCIRCSTVSTSSAVQRQLLTLDPSFRLILSNASKLTPYDYSKIEETIDKCITFLRKYGDEDWCDEIAKIVDAYINTLQCQISRPVY
ncbi:SET and MYND domain-containing protein 4-like [Contarinia nasturtii]|uniref:SET and MYND domain-containing protein 4-like n=1 Tax=Contarinia nasturtii TaxID=265458 RepID=UPI0012D40CB5|nr:SET and MYND domain-containing protein 4-like [Contarinia nasturtii]